MCKALVMICGKTNLAPQDGGCFILLTVIISAWLVGDRPYHPITLITGLCPQSPSLQLAHKRIGRTLMGLLVKWADDRELGRNMVRAGVRAKIQEEPVSQE